MYSRDTGRGNSREEGGGGVYSRDMGRGNSREGGGGVYSRDMGRGNSREEGGGGRPQPPPPCLPAPSPAPRAAPAPAPRAPRALSGLLLRLPARERRTARGPRPEAGSSGKTAAPPPPTVLPTVPPTVASPTAPVLPPLWRDLEDPLALRGVVAERPQRLPVVAPHLRRGPTASHPAPPPPLVLSGHAASLTPY